MPRFFLESRSHSFCIQKTTHTFKGPPTQVDSWETHVTPTQTQSWKVLKGALLAGCHRNAGQGDEPNEGEQIAGDENILGKQNDEERRICTHEQQQQQGLDLDGHLISKKNKIDKSCISKYCLTHVPTICTRNTCRTWACDEKINASLIQEQKNLLQNMRTNYFWKRVSVPVWE